MVPRPSQPARQPPVGRRHRAGEAAPTRAIPAAALQSAAVVTVRTARPSTSSGSDSARCRSPVLRDEGRRQQALGRRSPRAARHEREVCDAVGRGSGPGLSWRRRESAPWRRLSRARFPASIARPSRGSPGTRSSRARDRGRRPTAIRRRSSTRSTRPAGQADLERMSRRTAASSSLKYTMRLPRTNVPVDAWSWEQASANGLRSRRSRHTARPNVGWLSTARPARHGPANGSSTGYSPVT